MLRVAVQSLHHLGRPLDVMLSFCQHTIHSFDQSTGKTNLELFAPLLLEQAGVKQLINASPLSMGLLTPRGPPPWHPAPQDLRLAISNVARALPVSIASVALRFGLRSWKDQYVPTIAGWSCPEEVDACMVAKTASDVDDPTLDQVESLAKHLLQAEGGWGGWSWPAVWAP